MASSLSDYHMYEMIGQSEHSVVYRGRRKKAIEFVAVKSIEQAHSTRVLNHVSVLSKLEHANILRFHAWYKTNNHVWVITEYCAGGSLYKLLREDTKLPEDGAFQAFASDIASALQYIHSQGFVFGDLKTSNILFNEYGVLKLNDCGLSRSMSGDVAAAAARAKCGTPYYMAPEQFKLNTSVTCASDIWSFGVVLFEMATGMTPFRTKVLHELINEILHTEPSMPSSMSPELQDLIRSCLVKLPEKRITWPDLCNHPFWQSPLPLLVSPEEPPPQPENDIDGDNADDQRQLLNAKRHLGGQEQCGGDADRCKEEAASEVTLTSCTREHEVCDADAAEIAGGDGAADDAMIETLRPQRKIVLGGAKKKRPQSALASVKPRRQTIGHIHVPQKPETVFDLLQDHINVLVQPIIDNSFIEQLPPAPFKTSMLPFRARSIEEVAERHDELTLFLTDVYKAIEDRNSSVSTRLNVLKYFSSLFEHHQSFANCVINSGVMTILVERLDSEANVELKQQLTRTMGLLCRHATVFHATLIRSCIFEVLGALFRHSNIKVRRRAAATLGEFLYLVSSQPSAASGSASPDADSLTVPDDTFAVVLGALRTGEDDIVRHYSAKAIENIAASSPKCATKWFCSEEMVFALVQIYESSSNVALRVTSACALSQLLRPGSSFAEEVLPRLGWPLLLAGLSNPPDTGHLSLQQDSVLAFVHLVNISLAIPTFRPPEGGSHDTLLHTLMGLLEASLAIRIRALLALGQLVLQSPLYLLTAFELHLGNALDRLSRDREDYAKRCLTTFAKAVADVVQPLLHRTAAKMAPDHSHPDQMEEELAVFPVVVHCASSSVLQRSVMTAAAQPWLATILRVADARPEFESTGECRSGVLTVLELMSQNSEFLVEGSVARKVVHHLLPALLTVMRRHRRDHNADTRFLCLKVLADITATLLQERSLFEPSLLNSNGSAAELQACTTRGLHEFIVQQLLPLFEGLLHDKDLLPQFASRLLSVIVEADPEVLGIIEKLHLEPTLIGMLEPVEHATLSVVKVVRALVSDSRQGIEPFYQLGLLPKLNAVFAYSFGRSANVLSEPLLDIYLSILDRLSSSEPDDASLAQNESLICNGEILLMLISSSSDHVLQEKSAECMLGLVLLYPEYHEFWTSNASLRALLVALDSWQGEKASALLVHAVEAIWHLTKTPESRAALLSCKPLRHQLVRIYSSVGSAEPTSTTPPGSYDLDRDISRIVGEIVSLFDETPTVAKPPRGKGKVRGSRRNLV